MRFREIIRAVRLRESSGLPSDENVSSDLSDHIEDDADNEANIVLADTLRELIFSAHEATVPKISVQALINLVRMRPGGEAFNYETLKNAQSHDETIKELVANIKDDDNGTKYVFLKTETPDTGVENQEDDAMDPDSETETASETPPQKTVSSMAKRAVANRS
jgi:hypothetical protein